MSTQVPNAGMTTLDISWVVFYGTFIDLPRIPKTPATASTRPEHVLSVNRGVLWVSAQAGRIEGANWEIYDEDSLSEFIDRMDWEVEGSIDEVVAPKKRIRLVKERKGRNSFFFPGFIGKLLRV